MANSESEFIEWVEAHRIWYEADATKWRRTLNFCKVVSLVTSLGTIVVAAAGTADFLATWGKWLIVATTLLSAAASELLAQFQVSRMEELRENGNLECADMVAYCRDKFEEVADDRARIGKIKDEIRERIRKLERTQHRQFVDIYAAGERKGNSATPSKAGIG